MVEIDSESYLVYLGSLQQDGAGPNYVKFLYKKVMEVKPKFILELGAGSVEKYGFISSRVFLLALENLGGGYLMSVDKARRINFDDIGLFSKSFWRRWIILFMDDVLLSEFLVMERMVDFLYIDTDHTYELTKKELELYSPFLSENGVIILNDTQNKTINYRVMDAIKDFMNKHKGEWKFKDYPYLGWASPHPGTTEWLFYNYGFGEMRRTK